MGELIAILGPTGAGKSVQSEQLAALLSGIHLSSGDLLRRDPAEARRLESGELAPDNVVERIVAEAISQVSSEQVVVLDGFPRTVGEAAWMEQHQEQWGRELRDVIWLDVDMDTTAERLVKRGRSDDTPAAQAQKRREFEAATKPVLDYYQTAGLLRRVDGRGTVEEVSQRLQRVVAV